jgi:hypothetical protein
MMESRGFIEKPLTMVQRDYVEQYGDEKEVNIAVSLWSVYSYELAYLIASEIGEKIPKGFPCWDTTGAITLDMEFDYERIFQSTPKSLKYLRASKPMMSFVWVVPRKKFLTFGIFYEDIARVFHTAGFPSAFMLTRPSHEPIVVKYSDIVKSYQKALSGK